MDKLVSQAFEALKTLPEEDQERIAWEIIERVENKVEWDSIVSAPESGKWLERHAKIAHKEYAKIRKNLSMTYIWVGQDNMLREESYWKDFDELPAEIRRLAEKNYTLWKENPQHPGLRFKKIHAELPIFSFRIGMRHRTIGVDAGDGKVIWFWIGSIENFKKQIHQ